jgi:SAM-dependent methyltransferase
MRHWQVSVELEFGFNNEGKGFVNHKEGVDQGLEKPQIWHYGLVARDWVEFYSDGGDEAVYFNEIIQGSGQPALDLGCGSGRLLLPLLRSEIDVDGCDYSADMLAVCQERLKNEGLTTGLFNQPMHELDLPRRYMTIFACGVIGLGGSKRLTRLGMRRIYEHLRPGGAFVFDLQAPWNDIPYWQGWLPENRQALPLDWFEPQRRRLADGDELETSVQIFSQDPLTEISVHKFRVRLWRDGKMIREEIHSMKTECYNVSELVLMLELAGFGDVQIHGDYRAEPATMDTENLIFVARK